MTEAAHKEVGEDRSDAYSDAGALLASLRAAGADKFDPLRLHYLEMLAERAAAQQGMAKRMLDAKLMRLLEAFKERFTQVRSEANEIVTDGAQRYPHAAAELQGLFSSGNFEDAQRLLARLKSREQGAPLRALVQRLEQHATPSPAAQAPVTAAPRAELKTLRESRSTWSKLSVDKQVAQALAQAPKNAGPINSHMLVLRSLALMRELSPDYLNRFISYADTLLCLEQGENEKADKPKRRQAVSKAKK